MFKVQEVSFSGGDTKPIIRTVATRAKKQAAKTLADDLNRKQDLVDPSQGIKSYMVG